MVPWVVAGGALVAGVIILAVTQLDTGGRPPSGPAGPPIAAGGGVPDISQMTPRELANATFNRTMAAEEQGKEDTVAFFAPKAIAAYQLLATLDEDARYHMGLVHIAIEQYDEALVQADTIAATVATHLFAWALRIRVARARGDRAALATAQRAFLDNYEAERVAARVGYSDHSRLLEEVRNRALQELGGGASR